MTIKIFPYKSGSKSAKALSEALGAKRLKHEGSVWKEKPGDMVINWGSSRQLPYRCVLNKPEAVYKAVDKLLALKAMAMHGVVVPPFTTEPQVALQWLLDGSTLVARTKLRGHSGDGIVILQQGEPFIEAPLYVKYVAKKDEYRVHMDRSGYVIDQQRKARNLDVADEDVNWKVRNHANGFIFMREGVDVPPIALGECELAIRALGLDFGAVDIIYNELHNEWYVLEVNTACGLEGTTLDNYVKHFRAEL